MPGTCDQAIVDALKHLEAALGLLDEADAPAQIGAHVDLAICQLRDAFPQRPDVARAERNLSTD